MLQKKPRRSQWVTLIAGPILSLIAFVIAFYINPLNFRRDASLAAVPAFLLSVVVLMIGHNIATFREVERTSADSDRIFEAVRDYLHVTKIGSPETAWKYVMTRLPILLEVRNTAFTLSQEIEVVDEKLYDTSAYDMSWKDIALWTDKKLRWKDVGDKHAIGRFRRIANLGAAKEKPRYQYKCVSNVNPQINFIILSYPDGVAEVLFNWDFRSLGQDPIVLLSRDREIVRMFGVQFDLLWLKASPDHDRVAT